MSEAETYSRQEERRQALVLELGGAVRALNHEIGRCVAEGLQVELEVHALEDATFERPVSTRPLVTGRVLQLFAEL